MFDRQAVERLSKDELKLILEAMGLSTRGRSAELVDRVCQNLDALPQDSSILALLNPVKPEETASQGSSNLSNWGKLGNLSDRTLEVLVENNLMTVEDLLLMNANDVAALNLSLRDSLTIRKFIADSTQAPPKKRDTIQTPDQGEDPSDDLGGVPGVVTDVVENERITKRSEKVTTILLLGETGVGKATFINAFSNYLNHETLAKAKSEDVVYLSPSHFVMYDHEYREKKITVGEFNESKRDGVGSATQFPQCYVLPAGDRTIKLIDTPGIGDTEGPLQDDKNMERLSNFLGHYEHINAICILLKSNNSKLSVFFKYCILKLLSNLDKNASKNIIFLFTNSRATFYTPGDAGPVLRALLKENTEASPDVNIPFQQENTFCLDNEAFRFLVAQSPPNNMKFTEHDANDFEATWTRSVMECQRMLRYIDDLAPHNVEDITSINKARTLIHLLTKPLADIAQLIEHNVENCNIQRRKLEEYQGDMAELQKELYTPVERLIETALDEPMTVCGHADCCEMVNANNMIQQHYIKFCHRPCYLRGSDSSIIGNVGLLDCQAFNTYVRTGPDKWCPAGSFHPDNKLNETGGLGPPSVRTNSEYCNQCSHSFKLHLHVHTSTERTLVRVENKQVSEKLKSKSDAAAAKAFYIRTLEAEERSLRHESDEINKCVAMFACFSFNNALTAFNDAYEDYMMYLIEVESRLPHPEKAQRKFALQRTLELYQIQRQGFRDFYRKGDKRAPVISPKEIEANVERLTRLRINGPAIRQHLEPHRQQNLAVHTEFTEVRVTTNKIHVLTFFQSAKKIMGL